MDELQRKIISASQKPTREQESHWGRDHHRLQVLISKVGIQGKHLDDMSHKEILDAVVLLAEQLQHLKQVKQQLDEQIESDKGTVRDLQLKQQELEQIISQKDKKILSLEHLDSTVPNPSTATNNNGNSSSPGIVSVTAPMLNSSDNNNRLTPLEVIASIRREKGFDIEVSGNMDWLFHNNLAGGTRITTLSC